MNFDITPFRHAGTPDRGRRELQCGLGEVIEDMAMVTKRWTEAMGNGNIEIHWRARLGS